MNRSIRWFNGTYLLRCLDDYNTKTMPDIDIQKFYRLLAKDLCQVRTVPTRYTNVTLVDPQVAIWYKNSRPWWYKHLVDTDGSTDAWLILMMKTPSWPWRLYKHPVDSEGVNTQLILMAVLYKHPVDLDDANTQLSLMMVSYTNAQSILMMQTPSWPWWW